MVFSFLRTSCTSRIIELEGHKKYKYVILEMNDPTDTAAEIKRKIRKLN